MDESLSIEDVRRLASECGGLREIYFSRRSNKVSFARDATDGKASGWRINVFWTTATCSTEPLVEGTDGVSAEEQPKRKPHFRRNVSLQRLREIMLDPGQTQACGNAPWAPPGSKLADQLEAGVFNLTRYLKGDC